MADNDTPLEDRTESATPKRLDDARRRGQVPRSRELSMALVLGAGAAALYGGRGELGSGISELMVRSLRFDRAALEDPDYMVTALGSTTIAALELFIPLFVAVAAAAIAGSIAIGGWLLSPSPLAFKPERLDPVKGLGRVFSLNGFVEVLKAIAKAVVILAVSIGFLWTVRDAVLGLGHEPVGRGLAHAMSLSLLTLAAGSFALLLIAAVDAPYQLWSHARQLRMTRQEVVDELKESEGRPEVRSRIRQLQQEVSRRRMLADVPKADVIVTNPTHFAVALRYEDGRMRAPVVLAKGTDHVAARIRQSGEEHGITFFEAPLLARALYWTTDIGQEIPAPLYLAVAQVLTYVYRLRAARTAGGPLPDKPTVEVDPQLAERPRRAGRRPLS
ncbi:MAG: flagellar biosynthesis protein FlhB [Chromatiales bacterium]|nr:flagellar biosynthesis protein FlhB [Chromatiales bacterium]